MLKLEDVLPETGKDGESILRSTREVLNNKHSLCKEPDTSCLVDDESEPVNSIIFDDLDAGAIRHAALHTLVQLALLDLMLTHGEDCS